MKPDLQEKLKSLNSRSGSIQNPAFERALASVAIERAHEFLGGIRSYWRHTSRRNVEEAPVFWQAGTTIIRDYKPSSPDAPPVLVIPSLINRFDILDLDPAHSFVRTLALRGFRPLVVDWDMPGDEEKNFALGDYVCERLVPVIDAFAAFKKPLHVLGYCMGGNLALALAMQRRDAIASLTLLATPWDFHRPDPNVGPQFLELAEQMEPHLRSLGFLPVDVIQSLFASFQPAQVLTKFSEFAGLDPTSVEARHFVLCEDWLNDGVPLTAPVARECFKGWYGENLPGKLSWMVNGIRVDPRELTMPTYIIAPGKDRIVPPESALPLAKLIPRATLHEPMTGHVGMIASPKAPAQVWAAFMSWIEQHK